jgi:carboxyl-terminal processing protease
VAHDRAITIGETTYGTGTSLATFDFDDGSSMMLGVELWLTPDEESIWMVGLDPMIEVRNEPGAQLLYPQMYPDGVISDDEFAQSEDIQLRTGFEEVLRLVADQ